MMQADNCSFSGDILKKIRKLLGFRQHEIVGNEITRNLISLIESNKVRLNESTANILIRNMNRLSKERNLGIKLDERDFKVPGIFEAKQTADSYIKNLPKHLVDGNNDISEYVHEINIFLSDWDLPPQKASIYEILGDYYYKNLKFYNCYIYYIKSFENYLRFSDLTQLAEIVLKIMRSCIRLNRYHESLEYSDIIVAHKDEISYHVFIRITYNRAMAYKYLSDFDSCMKEIAKIEPIIDAKDITTYIYTMTLKAICYKSKEMYDDALTVYDTLLNVLIDDDIENRLIVLTNILEIHRFTGKHKKILEYLELVISLIEKFDSNSMYFSQIHTEIALTYEYLENSNLAEQHFNHSLKYAISIKDLDTIKRVVNKLLNLHIDKNQSQIDEFKNKMLFLLENHLLETDNPSIFKLISYYNKINRAEEIDRIIQKLLYTKGDEFND